jgi:hypothetical protein
VTAACSPSPYPCAKPIKKADNVIQFRVDR